LSENKDLQAQTGRAVEAQAPRQTQPARSTVIEAEYSEVKAEAPSPQREGGGSGFMAWMRNNHAQQPSLGAQAMSWLREGAKDLWNAIVPAFPDSQRAVDEQGTPLNPTPQNVTAALGNFHGYDADHDQSTNSSYRGQFQNKDQERYR
jgi:hypothetical protein